MVEASGGTVSTSVDVSGFKPQFSREIALDAAPIIRQTLDVALPECEQRGVYLVEMIANGHSSRAVIYKGWLGFRELINAAGLLLMCMTNRRNQ